RVLLAALRGAGSARAAHDSCLLGGGRCAGRVKCHLHTGGIPRSPVARWEEAPSPPRSTMATPLDSPRQGIARLPAIDSTAGFLIDGYAFGLRRFHGARADAFRTRLAGLPVVIMRGADAARTFYEG